MAGWGAIALQLLPSVVGALGNVASSWINSQGSNSSAMNQNTMNTQTGNTSMTGNTSQTTGTQGAQVTQGSTSGISDILGKALTGITGNNSQTAANFNAGQATTANNLQSGQWALGNLMNLWSNARANELTAQSQASAMAFNREESQKNRDWQQMMSSTAYQRGVKDLKEAGLNPALAAYNGFGASSGSGGQAAVGNSTFSHAQASAIPAAHTATMQAMYDYGNNTSQFLQNAMQAINTAKETKNWEEAGYMQSIMQNIGSTSAKTVGNIAQTANNTYNNKSSEETATAPRIATEADKAINDLKNKWNTGGKGKFSGSGSGRGR
jgi:hypothetical protein